MADFLLIPCFCGVRIKVPPGFGHDNIDCPRCRRSYDVPQVAQSTSAARGSTLEYHKRGDGWDSFRCSCGKVIHLIPAVRVPRTKCTKCGTFIDIV